MYVKSRCAQVQRNTAHVNTKLHVLNQFLYDYYNLRNKTSVTDVQLCQDTKIHTLQELLHKSRSRLTALLLSVEQELPSFRLQTY